MQQPVLNLLYHEVSDEPHLSGFRQPTAMKYKHRTAIFEEHLRLIAESQRSVILPGQNPNSQDKAPVVFTFDDGGISAMTAAEMLESHGWRGVFFVISGFVGNQGFLDKSHLRELLFRGHIIGSHSDSHPVVFRELDPDTMDHEWGASKQKLEQIIDTPVTIASIPGGDMNDETVRSAARMGYTDIYTSEPLVHSWPVAGISCHGRAIVTRHTSVANLERWLNHGENGLRRERLIRQCKTMAKKALGPVYRGMVARRRAKHG